MHLVVLGGSDAGVSAALRARELDANVEITMLLADRYPNYSICGLPFFLSGEVSNWRALAHRSRSEIEDRGIAIQTEHVAERIDAEKQCVSVRANGETREVSYDRLIISTGATPQRPPVTGLDSPDVYVLHTMNDSFSLRDRLANARSAVIIGAGYIGVEMADALSRRGLAVTVVERLPSVLTTVDPQFGEAIKAELERHGITVLTETIVESIDSDGGGVRITGSPAFTHTADLALVVVGVRPASELAATAGAELGERGAIRVNQAMETNLPDVYAAGDCAETWHRLLEQNSYVPLGTTSHKQGRIAGENAVGGHAMFEGVVGTQAVKVFDCVVAGTGLTEAHARKAGFDVRTVETRVTDHKTYYPGATEMRLRIAGDAQSGRLLGAQILGAWSAEVAKRIDVFATALYHSMCVQDLNDLDLSYTPPVSSPWDPIQLAAQAWNAQVDTRAEFTSNFG